MIKLRMEIRQDGLPEMVSEAEITAAASDIYGCVDAIFEKWKRDAHAVLISNAAIALK